MTWRISDRLRVSGYRFLLRRMEHAVLDGDAASDIDSVRGPRRSFALGGLLAVAAAAGCVVSGLLQTDPLGAGIPSGRVGNPVAVFHRVAQGRP